MVNENHHVQRDPSLCLNQHHRQDGRTTHLLCYYFMFLFPLALLISLLFIYSLLLLNSHLILRNNHAIRSFSLSRKEIESSSAAGIHSHIPSSSPLDENNSVLSYDIQINFTQTKGSLSRTLIVTSSDVQYKGILLNWMYSMKLLQIEDYLILCYDREIYDLVGDWNTHNGHGIFIQGCQTRNQKFQMRHQIAYHFLKNNYTIILTDCDCLWLQDFRLHWIQPYHGKVDVIGQIGTHPVDVYEKYGYAVCAGLLVLFPTQKTINFYQKLLKLFHGFEISSQQEIDDQSLINHLLESFNSLQYFNSTIHHLPSISEMQSSQRNKDFISSSSQRNSFLHLPNSSSSKLKLGLFPFNYFPRISQTSSSSRLTLHHYYQYYSQYCPMVWHLKPPFHHPSAYIYQLQRSNLFRLTPQWKDLTSFSQLADYFHSLDTFHTIENHC
jgi:hypothetical protein